MDALPILVTDESGLIVRANAPAIRRFGDCVGRRCAEVVAADDAEGTLRCRTDCASEAICDPERTSSARGTVGRAVSEVYCTPLGREVVVVVHPVVSSDGVRALLSRREIEVVALVSEGNTMREAAERLGLSVTTIRTHLDHARTKLGAATLPDLVARALALGLRAPFAS